jgi:hypothetical protein
MMMANSAKAATTPSTPPIIAPRFEDAAVGMPVGVLDGEAVSWGAAWTDDNAVAPVVSEVVVSALVDKAVGEAGTDVDETVVTSVSVVVAEAIIFAVTSGNRLTLPAVVSDNVSDDVVVVLVASSSSGQTPVVHGSLEQHPRKSPAVQTYHCLPPLQVLASRGKRDSRGSMSMR